MHTLRYSLTAFAAAVLMTACGGGDKSASTPAADTTAAAPATAPTDTAPAATVASASTANGEEIYGRCMACHQATGAGMPGAFPPLAGSEWVTGPSSRPIAILLHGLQGEITVKGEKYNSMMMAYGTSVPMSDDEVAAVLTYVRSSFGNSAPPVTPAEVAKVRAATASRTTPMTQKDLEALQ
ncbi:cytochrome c [Gemmatimonas sp.]|uniref:c-type cytochrome n=1 Tax=Gemmatimonas sp. TaxID=1962908 RepID=UPI003340714E